jgi:glycosyltransferase involved in cell wall biosynthesis
MTKVAILRARQQDAEALGTQFQQVFAFYNSKRRIVTRKEMISSDHVKYIPYNAVGLRQETGELFKWIKEISPDIIYINSLIHLLTIGLLLRVSKITNKRPIVIATSHNSRIWLNPQKRLLAAILLNWLADGILTLATYQEKWLLRYRISPNKIRTIPNPVDIDLFSPAISETPVNPMDCPVLINIADLIPIKSQETIIKALCLVKRIKPKVKLILMGGQYSDSEYGCYIKDLIDKNHLEDNVINVGDIDHQEVVNLLRSSDISILSSLSEVCPYAVLESLAAGKVMIATAVGGIPDLIDNGSNGFLFQPGDAGELNDCILKVLNDTQLKMDLEKNARKSAEKKYSYPIIGGRHLAFVESLNRYKK